MSCASLSNVAHVRCASSRNFKALELSSPPAATGARVTSVAEPDPLANASVCVALPWNDAGNSDEDEGTRVGTSMGGSESSDTETDAFQTLEEDSNDSQTAAGVQTDLSGTNSPYSPIQGTPTIPLGRAGTSEALSVDEEGATRAGTSNVHNDISDIEATQVQAAEPAVYGFESVSCAHVEVSGMYEPHPPAEDTVMILMAPVMFVPSVPVWAPPGVANWVSCRDYDGEGEAPPHTKLNTGAPPFVPSSPTAAHSALPGPRTPLSTKAPLFLPALSTWSDNWPA